MRSMAGVPRRQLDQTCLQMPALSRGRDYGRPAFAERSRVWVLTVVTEIVNSSAIA